MKNSYSEEHFNLLSRFDYENFKMWRSINPDVVLNLVGADLSHKLIGTKGKLPLLVIYPANFEDAILVGTKFINCDLSNVNFSGANLSRADLTDANLNKVNLSCANLTETNLTKAYLSKAYLIKANLYKTVLTEADLSLTDLSEAYLGNVHLKKTHFLNANLNKVDFTKANIDDVDFTRAFLGKTNFSEARLNNVNFTAANLKYSNFNMAELSRINFSESILDDAKVNCGFECIYNEAKLFNTQFTGRVTRCSFKKAKGSHVEFGLDGNEPDFSNADLPYSLFKFGNITNANFSETNLSNSHFSKTRFESCKFRSSNLSRIFIERETIIELSNFENALIDRYTLECIPENQIPKYSRLKMIIEDDLAKLRQYYSGYYRFINGILLFLFLAPYAKFTFLRWLEAKFYTSDSINTITLVGAIGRFIVSGGKSWQVEWQPEFVPIFIFSIALFYNILRTILLIKTFDLEHKQEIRGLPINFSLKDSWWDKVLKINYIMFYVNLIVVLFHTYFFLLQKVNAGVG